MLLRFGLRKRCLITAPLLTNIHRKKYRQHTFLYKNWSIEQWKNIAFSDESYSLVYYCIELMGRWGNCREATENKLPPTTTAGR
ncbi:hypothetical protein TNIN_393121 [Trichonephila inaurata madagascariensis]|uniref:Uncharacterized protein n=1 Tax=Trichonephila inaurata madagascariensis TaxID=2747483 RepID=A0A8X7CUZ9_9ARAC|nr:hypothetical protein TNIN_207741 [Trichonephila inaurata madagascariensis]GFY79702.1 hypothetical protein TNIN_393121 [Trichonephila inaurata madagascariensis]